MPRVARASPSHEVDALGRLAARNRATVRHLTTNAPCRGSSSWRCRPAGTGALGGNSPRKLPPRAQVPLEHALERLATSAAYDLRTDAGAGSAVAPMLWHYQVVNMHVLPQQTSRWPDGAMGHSYHPVLLEVTNERMGRPYADEADFNQLPRHLRDSLGPLPLLVRIQFMNVCHTTNGAAAMALVRHAALAHVQWTIGGQPVRAIGWKWGDCPEGALALTISQLGTQRVRQQAHAHQLASFVTDDSEYILDLSVAQFGIDAALRAVPGVVPPCAGADLSPTLAQRAAQGLAPGLFAPVDSPAARLFHSCRVARGQDAVEAALALVGPAGAPVGAGYALCDHMMPSPTFRRPRAERGGPAPDDDLIEGELLERLAKFGLVLAA